MKSKIFLVILSLIITISAVAGATYAWFTDYETSTGNTFISGTVDIEVERANGDYIPGPMFYTTAVEGATPGKGEGVKPTGLWAPGMKKTRQLSVRNVGSLQVRLYQVGAEITSMNGVGPPFSSDLATLTASFASKMNIKIYASDQDEMLYNGTLAGLLNTATCSYMPVIQPDSSPVALNYEITMIDNAGNELQGIKPVVSFWVGAEQTKNNP